MRRRRSRKFRNEPGCRLSTRAQLWPRLPDKVFAVTAAWAEENPQTLQALLRALLKAAAWTADPAHRGELAALLAQPQHVGAPAAVIEASLADMIFDAAAPLPTHAERLLAEMIRWGHAPPETDIQGTAAAVSRLDLFQAAAASLAPA